MSLITTIKRKDTYPYAEIQYLDSEGDPIDLTDYDAYFSLGFYTELSTDIDSTDTVFAIRSLAEKISNGDKIVIDNESMTVTDVDVEGKLLTVTRGVDGTVAAPHQRTARITVVLIDHDAAVIPVPKTDGIVQYQWTTQVENSGEYVGEFTLVDGTQIETIPRDPDVYDIIVADDIDNDTP